MLSKDWQPVVAVSDRINRRILSFGSFFFSESINLMINIQGYACGWGLYGVATVIVVRLVCLVRLGRECRRSRRCVGC